MAKIKYFDNYNRPRSRPVGAPLGGRHLRAAGETGRLFQFRAYVAATTKQLRSRP